MCEKVGYVMISMTAETTVTKTNVVFCVVHIIIIITVEPPGPFKRRPTSLHRTKSVARIEVITALV